MLPHLYPLLFSPRLLEKIWGGQRLQTHLNKSLPPNTLYGESWEIYDFPPNSIDQSLTWTSARISNGPLATQTLHDLLLSHPAQLLGPALAKSHPAQFPLLIKFLDARENLSVQVHPPSRYTALHPEAHLKSEAWYVLHAEPNAKIYKGLHPGVTPTQFRQAIESHTVESLITAIPAHAGDCHYLPSGTLHALGAGILVAEVQTPSDTTFRVYDFNRLDPATQKLRTLHVPQALDCIDFNPPPPEHPQKIHHEATRTIQQLVDCEFFRLNKIRATTDSTHPLPPQLQILMPLNTPITVTTTSHPPTTAQPGQTLLLSAQLQNPQLQLSKNAAYLQITLPQ